MQPPQGRIVPAMAPKGGSNDPRLMLKLQTAIVDTERLGELFLDVRRQKVECDKQRQALREALTALKKTHQSKAWLMRPGGVLMKSSADDARSTLERDQREVEDKLEMLRAEEKRLTRLIADQGAAPSSVGPGMLNAMLNLKDNKAKDTVDLYSLD